jgi:cytochrome P450
VLPHASLLDDARFNALFVVPQALQGLFRRRETVVTAMSPLDLDGRVVELIDDLHHAAGDGPVWLHLLTDRALLLLAPGDIRRVLDGSPDPFAADPPTKRKGMGHFQPDAVTLSRGARWRSRRAFTEHVLDTERSRHRFADRFESVAGEEVERRLTRTGGRLTWGDWHTTGRRIARRVVLGDAAADDEHLTDQLAQLMGEANRLPSGRSPLLDSLLARIEEYAARPEPDSLLARFADAPVDRRTAPIGQVPHWLFAFADTLPVNSFRALALLATHPELRTRSRSEATRPEATDRDGLPFTAAVLEEAMRLWPTTPVLARVAIRDLRWNGGAVPAGTQLVVVNTYHHRNVDLHPWADRCAPEMWTSGVLRDDWTFNHFSNGPQGCPGAGLARLVGARTLATVLSHGVPRLRGAVLDPEHPLPRTLAVYGLRFRLSG